MKKIIAMVAMAAMFAASTATAQKVNSTSFESRLAKSDVEIANPKKSAKSSTWFNRAKICTDAILEPTKQIFVGLDANMLNVTIGAPLEMKGDGVFGYEWVDIYTKDDKVKAWSENKLVLPKAYEIALEAYNKAYELDPASAAKIKTALESLINHYSELGSVSIDINKYAESIDAYLKAAELQKHPAIGKVDPRYYFYAGQLAAYLGSKDGSFFVKGEKYLNAAKELGYTDELGNIFYFLFHCYYGQRAENKDNLMKAKNALLEGIEKFPRNQRIMEGLIQLYTSEEGVGNPADLVGRIDQLLAEKPDNADLWFARGQVFFKLRNFDECINSFESLAKLRPNDYDTNFYLGYFYMAKGDEVNRAFNSRLDSINSQEEYQAGLKEVSAAYMKALPWLEKALELKPEDVNCAEYLKSLCFRLRNEDGVMDKYNKYNAIYKKLKGIQ